VTEVTGGEEVVAPLANVGEDNVEAGGDDAGLNISKNLYEMDDVCNQSSTVTSLHMAARAKSARCKQHDTIVHSHARETNQRCYLVQATDEVDDDLARAVVVNDLPCHMRIRDSYRVKTRKLSNRALNADVW
jgi:hypothetical protein